MELSQFTDFSLRTLMYIGARQDRRPKIHEVADAYQISQNHLVKVVNKLSKLGYLQTFRGRAGGVALGKPPADIKIGEVIRATEVMLIAECFNEQTCKCCLMGFCELQRALAKARDAFLAELDEITLEDLLGPKAALQRALGIPVTPE